MERSPVDEAALAKAERQYGVEFPADYRAFLREADGREGQSLTLEDGKKRREPFRGYFDFFSLEQALQEHGWYQNDQNDYRVPDYLLPIGRADYHGVLLLSLEPRTLGHLYVIDWGHEGMPETNPGDPSTINPVFLAACEAEDKIADSLSEFLAHLQPWDPEAEAWDEEDMAPFERNAVELGRQMQAGEITQEQAMMLMAQNMAAEFTRMASDPAVEEGLGMLKGALEAIDEDDLDSFAEMDEADSDQSEKEEVASDERWEALGEPLTEVDVAAAEAELGVTLPEAYRTAMLCHNGRTPRLAADLCTLTTPTNDVGYLVATLPLTKPTDKTPDVLWLTQVLREQCRLPRELLPIAHDHDNGIVLLGLDGLVADCVFLVKWQAARENEALWALTTDPPSLTPALADWLTAHCLIDKSLEAFIQRAKLMA